ncbi:hypothetical protein DH2020_004083 [Rehmannia glutinosa]|uniref:GAG-pre-integrase domain-containing protein n=1 Tax=Rehmannia glutinosa TaxID=99300 RepID=A0ABR0XNJ5_REHGL
MNLAFFVRVAAVENALVAVSRLSLNIITPSMSWTSLWDSMTHFLISGDLPDFRGVTVCCSHCKIHGHTVDKCLKLPGYPPGYKPRPKPTHSGDSDNQVSHNSFIQSSTSTDVPSTSAPNITPLQYQQLMTLLTSHMGALSSNPSSSITDLSPCLAGTYYTLSCTISYPLQWIVDSAASHHICCHASAFSSLHPIVASIVTLPNNATISSKFAWDVPLSPTLSLKDGIFLPQFHFNLPSVRALTTMPGLVVTFLPDSFLIHGIHNQTLIGKGNRIGDLYILDSTAPNIFVNSVTNSSSAQLWYSRLGHLSWKHLNLLQHRLKLGHLHTSDLNLFPLLPSLKIPHLPQLLRRLPLLGALFIP